ncbi:hypothetical protein Aple_025460 [Acrocarpospora pleiomorpha]|uniref:Uncharacterized protein n=1 Tax=Acrocarpospora pleiomorpha TaxID=90975 RepID=A0A5M3XF15_9ACTN|nr:hypothetical protein [Acrocarpospora pleiomorpha]GES19650.1 hypothetical protein Aple_025460 [Acrocarpospora pleiomorpha]
MQHPDLDRVMSGLAWIRDARENLLEALYPGTPVPAQPLDPLGLDLQALRDAEARVECMERSETTLGESPAPIRLDVFDVLVDITRRAYLNAWAVHQASGHPWLYSPDSTITDPQPWLGYIHFGINQLGHEEKHHWLVDEIGRNADELISRIIRVLGLIHDGQTIAARVPGVRASPPGGSAPFRAARGAIVCESGTCEASTSKWWWRRPVWPIKE